MKTYQFTIPDSKASLGFDAELARRFGGFTTYQGYGVWRNDKLRVTEQEPVTVYQVSVSLFNRRRLVRFVLDELRELGEQAAYIGVIGSAVVIPL